MALINCPECAKEISDSVNTCPHCGFALKTPEKHKKPTLLYVVIGVLVLAIAGFFVFNSIIKPQRILNEAQNLIERGRLSEADVLLASMPASQRKSELLTTIALAEAKAALAAGNYTLAEEKLNQVPQESITEDIKAEINTQKATVLLGTGQYFEADALYAQMEQTEEVITQRTALFYESRILACALEVKSTLLFPESMKLSEGIVLGTDGKTPDKALSTEETAHMVADQPTVVLHYLAKTKGGKLSDGFVRFTWNEEGYSRHTDVNSLKEDDERPSYYEYMDLDEQLDYLLEQLEISFLNLSLSSDPWIFQLSDEQVDRLNLAIHNYPGKEATIIPNNEVVPSPTPEIVPVTPSPAPTPEA